MANRNGFTLIEVLIALAIIAIALVAIVVAVGNSERTATHIKTTLLAHWVADNVLAELQVNMKQLPASGTIHGKSTMLLQTFAWRAGRVQGIKQKTNTVYQRVFVNVRAMGGSPLTEIQGFVRVDGNNEVE